MKYIKSIFIAVAVTIAFAIFLANLPGIRGHDVDLWTSIFGVIAIIFSIYKVKAGEDSATIASDALGSIKDVKETIESNLESRQAEYFSVAEQEYEDGEIDKGLWSQALVKAAGDEKHRKVEYMKLRAKQLKKK